MQSALREIAALDGVTVQGISSYPSGGGLRYDLEVLQRMLGSDLPPAQVLAASAPLLCGARWALLVDASSFGVILRTPLAPTLRRADLAGLAPLDSSHPGQLPAGPGDGDCSTQVAVIAVPTHQALVIGRPDGPPFANSELARLNYLAGAASACCTSTPDTGLAASAHHVFVGG